MKRDLLTIRDLSAEEVHQLIRRAQEMKHERRSGNLRPALSGKILGLIFVKPSTRTRVSFETAMYRLGGHASL
jgi:ornithine carbamoyltransferase